MTHFKNYSIKVGHLTFKEIQGNKVIVTNDRFRKGAIYNDMKLVKEDVEKIKERQKGMGEICMDVCLDYPIKNYKEFKIKVQTIVSDYGVEI